MTSHEEQEKLFLNLSPGKLFLRCALPSMVSMAVASLYTIADGIFVGRFLGAGALAAVNLVMPFIMITFALADMVAVGSSVQIAIRLGEKKELEASRIFSFSCMIILLFSILIGALSFLFSGKLIALLGASGEVADFALSYMRVYALFSPLIMCFFAVDNYLRICGRFRYSMMMNVVVSFANILLDWIFLGVLKMGIASAALASCICLASGSVICFWPFFRKKLILRFVKPRLSRSAAINIFTNGSSEFFSNITASTCMVLYNLALMKISGYMAVAAFSIIMYIDSIASSLLFGMSDSLQPAISYNYGAKNPLRVRALENRVRAAAFFLSIVVMAAMLLGGESLAALFIEKDSPELLAMSSHALRLFSLSYTVKWFGIVTSSYFTALNRPASSLITSMGQTIIFPVAGLVLLTRYLSLTGVWLTPAFTGVMTCMVALILLKRLRNHV